MKQGLSDSEHAALMAGAYKSHKRELGLIDNTEMGALNPMSLAEVQNKTVSWEELQKLCREMLAAKKAYYGHSQPNKVSDPLPVDDQIRFDMHENELHRQLRKAEDAYQAALKRYQEQTK